MKNNLLALLYTSIMFSSCDKLMEEKNNTEPIVEIIYPQNESTIYQSQTPYLAGFGIHDTYKIATFLAE